MQFLKQTKEYNNVSKSSLFPPAIYIQWRIVQFKT